MKNFFTLLIFAIFLLVAVVACNRNDDSNNGDTPTISVTGVSLNQSTASLVVGDTLQLTATVQPADATNRVVSWSSGDTTVATVNSTGLVTAVSSGTSTITVTTQDGNRTAICVVTVNPATIPVASVTLNQTSVTLVAGDTLSLTATVLPENATNKTVIWTSSNPNVVTVVNGIATTVSVGVATITATTEDGSHTATSPIAVVATQRGCNTNPAGWGESLGTVSFHSQGHNVVIEGNGITQTWSGAVTATNCNKTPFNGWEGVNNFNADCRSNPDFPGDLFSWCAVVRFADQLCPYPWRVPTQQDFIDLDIAMGGTGNFRADLDFINANYITRWGGAFGGVCASNGTVHYQGSRVGYWSQAESGADADGAFALDFATSGLVNPQSPWHKITGLPVRCVR